MHWCLVPVAKRDQQGLAILSLGSLRNTAKILAELRYFPIGGAEGNCLALR